MADSENPSRAIRRFTKANLCGRTQTAERAVGGIRGSAVERVGPLGAGKWYVENNNFDTLRRSRSSGCVISYLIGKNS